MEWSNLVTIQCAFGLSLRGYILEATRVPFLNGVWNGVWTHMSGYIYTRGYPGRFSGRAPDSGNEKGSIFSQTDQPIRQKNQPTDMISTKVASEPAKCNVFGKTLHPARSGHCCSGINRDAARPVWRLLQQDQPRPSHWSSGINQDAASPVRWSAAGRGSAAAFKTVAV